MNDEAMLRRLKDEETIPDMGEDLPERVWAAIAPQLQLHQNRKLRAWNRRWGKPWLLVAASVLLALALLSGGVWENWRHGAAIEKSRANVSQSAAERILLTAAADHLERSERFLVELQMSRAANGHLAQRARELLEDNRLYERGAVYAKDPAMADVLDRLGRVLAEVAHGEKEDGRVAGLAAGDLQLGELVRAIRLQQRRSLIRA